MRIQNQLKYNPEITLLIEDKEYINYNVVAAMLNGVFKQYHNREITSYIFKRAIIEICTTYGSKLFFDVNKKVLERNIEMRIAKELAEYIDICLADYRIILTKELPF